MSIDVRVPTTGNAGEDAVVVDWSVGVGAQVSQGDVLVTLETAKATIEVEAPAEGEVLRILYEAGDEVPEHEVLAVLGQAGEVPEPGAAAPSAAPEPGPTTSVSESTSGSAHEEPAAGSGTATPSDAPRSSRESGPRHSASPRARLLAERNGIDLTSIVGSGPGGRIIVGDVLAAKRTPAAAPPAPAAVASAPAPAAPTPTDPDEVEIVPVRGARKVTAQRMHASLQETAQVTLTRYADASAMLAYAARLKEVAEARGAQRPGINELVLYATAKAVAAHPEANSTFDWDGIRRYRSVHLGFAVDTGQALLVPVVRGADGLTLAELTRQAREAIEKARTGKLTTPEMEGGTFTVSNLGGLGVHWFTPVLNPPQTCILGVGAAHRTHPDAPALLPLSLTFDHRALDGAAAATLLADIARSIESVDVLSAL